MWWLSVPHYCAGFSNAYCIFLTFIPQDGSGAGGTSKARAIGLGDAKVLISSPPLITSFTSIFLLQPSMSLLREAEKCLANQHAHGLNAFITPLPRGRQWLDRVEEADQRRDQGTPITPTTYAPLRTGIDQECSCDRKPQVRH